MWCQGMRAVDVKVPVKVQTALIQRLRAGVLRLQLRLAD
jgi:hypothetical protein